MSIVQPLTTRISLVDPSMFFLLISSNKEATMSYGASVVVLLPIAMTKLSRESRREHNRMIHFSSSMILISTNNNWINTVLNAFKCSVTELPSLILRRYIFFLRNILFTRYFDWYKLPNLSHSFLAESSPHTFNSNISTRQSRIVLISLLSSFSHSSIDMPIEWVLGQIDVHFSQSTRRYSILSFQSSKFWPLNFSISILELLAIIYHL
jgi:hypothetical protein